MGFLFFPIWVCGSVRAAGAQLKPRSTQFYYYYYYYYHLNFKSVHHLKFKTIDCVHVETSKWLRLGTKWLSKNFNWYICNFRKRQAKRRKGMLSSRYRNYSYFIVLILPLTWVCLITRSSSWKKESESERVAYIAPTKVLDKLKNKPETENQVYDTLFPSFIVTPFTILSLDTLLYLTIIRRRRSEYITIIPWARVGYEVIK